MAKLCTYSGCKAIVTDGSYRCSLHPPAAPTFVRKHRYAHHYHNNKNIYYTNRWKKIVAIIKKEQPLCVMCEALGLATPTKIIDHIKEIEDGADPFERSNLQGLCHSHHNSKTARERKARKNTGKSLSDY